MNSIALMSITDDDWLEAMPSFDSQIQRANAVDTKIVHYHDRQDIPFHASSQAKL